MRLLLRRIHLVLSLAAGLWLAASGLSGAALVFGDALDPALHPDLFRATGSSRVPIDAVLARAEEASGGTAVRIRLAGAQTPVHEVWIDCDDCRRAFVDPATGAVNGIRSAHGTTRLFLHELHRRLLFRGPGDIAALCGGVVLLLVSASGILLGLRGGLRLRRASVYEVHRVVGLLAAPFLLIAGSTGIYFIQAGLRASAPAPSQPRLARSVDSLIARAAAEFPHAEPTWVSLAGPRVTVRFRQAAEAHPNGRTFVGLDARTGDVLSKVDALRVPPGTRFFDNLYPLHIGALGGKAHRTLLVLAGLTPAFFLITGVLLFWRRKRAAARARARTSAGSAASPSLRRTSESRSLPCA